MRTGAIFARGSCRALKWMALLGVVCALGAGTAAAQLTADEDDVKVTVSETVTEGSNGTIVVELTAAIGANQATSSDVTVTIGLVAKDVDADSPVTNEPADVVLNSGMATITFPANTDDDPLEDVVRSVSIPFGAGQDNDEAEDEIAHFTIALAGSGINLGNDALDGPFKVIIEDDETQEILLTEDDEGDATESATPIMLTLIPKFAFVDDDITVVLTHDGYEVADDFELSLSSQVFDAARPGPVAVTLTGPANDGNRDTDTVTVSLTVDDPSAEAKALDVVIADAHMLPSVTVMVTDADDEEAMELKDGDDYTLTVMLVDEDGEEASSSAEDLEVMLSLATASTADASDYRLQPASMVEIAMGESSGELTLLVTGGDSDFNPEDLVLDAQVSGDSTYGPAGPKIPGVVDLPIGETTSINVTPKTATEVQRVVDEEIAREEGDDGLYTAEDENLDFDASDFFNLPTMGFDIGLTVTSSPGNIVYTGDAGLNLWVGADPNNDPGTATITVTAVVSGVSAATISQNSANSASVMFDVTVHEVPEPDVTAQTDANVMAAYMAARTAAAGTDGLWTSSDGPATIALGALYNDLPATGVSADAVSSAASVIVASVSSSSGLVLTPVSAGSADITVTVNGVEVMFPATVDAIPVPGLDTRGRITSFAIAGTTEKTIDGVKRMHLDEGGITTASVTVTWTNEQLTSLWVGKTAANPPAPAMVNLYDTAWVDDAAVGRWLSLAETNERDGTGSLGGNDVVWGARDVQVKIPKKPTKNTDSTSVTVSEKGTTSLSLPHDDDAEPEAFRVGWWPLASSGVQYVGALQDDFLTANTHVIEDDDPQGVKLTKTTKGVHYEGGGTITFSATADPAREDLPLDVRYDLTDSDGVSVSSGTYTVDSSIGEIRVGPAGKDEVVLNVARNDGDRMDDMLQMHAEVVAYALDTGAFEEVDADSPVDFTVMDVHKLPLLSVMPETYTLMEGNKLELTLTVDRNPAETRAIDPETSQYTTEALSIAVMGSGAAGEYSLSSTAVPVPKYEHKAGSTWMQSVKVTVEATPDEDVEEDSMLMLDFVVNGTVAVNGPSDTMSDGAASVTIQDATTTQVSVRDNAYDVIQGALGTPPTLMTGMSGELMGANLFDYDASAVSVAYGTSVEGGAVTASASGGTVTIMAVMAGEAKVTITATATPNASSLVVNQTKANVAQLTFPVMVEEEPLEPLVFMVMGPDEMNLAEGGMGGMVTVSTNRAVTKNTEVMLMRDGSSSASDMDFELNPALVTIMSGGMEGSAMVMAVEDNMAEETEMLTLFLVVDGMQMTDKSVSFYIWDAAVPALPLIAQLLLAALLGLGGYRRYLRRR